MDGRARRVLGLGLLRAAGNRLNVAVAGVATAGALLLGSWVLLGMTAVSYGMAIALDMTRAGFWDGVIKDVRRRPPRLPLETDLVDESGRSFVRRLMAAREERERALGAASVDLRHCDEQTLGLLEAASEVEGHARTLLDRLDRLGRYLSDKNVFKCRAQLGEAAPGAESPDSVGSDRALAFRAAQGRLAALEDLVSHRHALVLRLEALIATLEMLPNRIVSAYMTDTAGTTVGLETTPAAELYAQLARLEAIDG